MSPNPASERSPSTLLDILFQYPIFNALCHHLDAPTLFKFRRVSKTFSDNYAAYSKERWGINRKLKHFVKDPKAFRSLLARYSAFISGSFAIQFLDDVFWEESDLDIFVREDQAGSFAKHLVYKEGYRFDSTSSMGPGEDGAENYEFEHTDTFLLGKQGTEYETKIQVISTREIPILSILSSFYTTAVINFISWNKTYSMFPDMTFTEPRYQCALQAEEDLPQPHIQKYQERGWHILDVPAAKALSLHSIELGAARRVGDPKTWKLDLDVEGIAPSEIPDFVVENAHFEVKKLAAATDYYRIPVHELSSHVLRYEYAYPMSGPNDFWDGFMKHRLNDLIMLELRKLHPEGEEPFDTTGYAVHSRQWINTLRVFMASFEKPDTWTYYDDRVPAWCEEWEKQLAERQLEHSMSRLAVEGTGMRDN